MAVRISLAFYAAFGAVLLVGCASHPRHSNEAGRPGEWHAPREILLKYDANHDGTVTRAELEAGLRTDFNRIDVTHDGCLSPDEVRAENGRRWKADASTYTPLIDWQQKGCIDFNSFAATARSLFDELDVNNDGKVTPEEMNERPKATGRQQKGAAGQGGGHHRRGGTAPQSNGGP